MALRTRGSAPSDAVLANLYRANLAIPAHRNWAATAKECVDFFEGRQWGEDEIAERKAAGRPTLTINKIRRFGRLIYGYFVQQRSQVVYRPGNDNWSSDDTAEILTKLSKNIDNRNGWKYVQADAFKDGIECGRGWFDVRLDFTTNHLGEVRITTRDPFSVFPDPEASGYDSAEWGYVLEHQWSSVEDILVQFGGASAAKVEDIMRTARSDPAAITDGMFYDVHIAPETHFGLLRSFERADDLGYWTSNGVTDIEMVDRARNLIRVLSCQSKQWVRGRQWVDLVTGETAPIADDVTREELQATLQYAEVLGQENGMGQTLGIKEGLMPRWRWTVTAADQKLYDEWSPYDAPTLVGFFPDFRRGVTHGLVHDLLDPQREINRRRSNMAEIISKMAQGGWIYEKGTLEPEDEDHLAEHGTAPGFNLGWTRKDQNTQPPQPFAAAMPPMSHLKMEELATGDLSEISGVNESALGEVDKVQSGRAVLARQRAAAVSIQSWMDGYERTLELVGRRKLRIIQTHYTEQRIFRERGEDGVDTPYAINMRMADGTIVNDVTRGSYDVSVDVAPMTATYQDLEFDVLMEMVEKGLPIPPDILVEAAPVSRKREIVDRIKGMMGMVPGAAPPGGGAPMALPAPGQGGGQQSTQLQAQEAREAV